MTDPVLPFPSKADPADAAGDLKKIADRGTSWITVDLNAQLAAALKTASDAVDADQGALDTVKTTLGQREAAVTAQGARIGGLDSRITAAESASTALDGTVASVKADADTQHQAVLDYQRTAPKGAVFTGVKNYVGPAIPLLGGQGVDIYDDPIIVANDDVRRVYRVAFNIAALGPANGAAGGYIWVRVLAVAKGKTPDWDKDMMGQSVNYCVPWPPNQYGWGARVVGLIHGLPAGDIQIYIRAMCDNYSGGTNGGAWGTRMVVVDDLGLMELTGTALQDVADNYATLKAVSDAFPTLQALADHLFPKKES